jgi:cytidylate kinase
MYRSLTARALASGVNVDDGPALAELASMIVFSVTRSGTLAVDGREPGETLTSAEVEANVSAVSSHPEVRSVLREVQRRMGESGAVMEGRDIGSAVFPDAVLKIFLAASAAERAARRVSERGGDEQLASELASRDAKDSRVVAHVPSEGAVVIETSGKSIDEVLAEALDLVRKRVADE